MVFEGYARAGLGAVQIEGCDGHCGGGDESAGFINGSAGEAGSLASVSALAFRQPRA